MTLKPPYQFFSFALFFSIISFYSNALAQEKQWQLGAGVGALDFNLYPGSRQTKTYVLPLPYFTYRSEFLEIDRGIRGLFPSDSDWYIDVSADFGLPVDSDDSQVRKGMTNLDAILQIGPSLEYTIMGKRNTKNEFRLELPLRTAIAVDIDNQTNEGWILEPRLVYEKQRSGRSGLFAKARVGLRFATQSYHAYYYDVKSEFVTPQRSAFESDKGYSGLVMDFRAAWRQNDVLFWGILRYQNIDHTAFEDSPLVEDNNYYFMGFGITWILAASH